MGKIQELMKNKQKEILKKQYDSLRSKALDQVEKGVIKMQEFEVFLKVLKVLR